MACKDSQHKSFARKSMDHLLQLDRCGNLQLAEYSERKLEEMRAVHKRFQEVLQKKDDSHANTKQKLKEAQSQAERYELLFEQQRGQLLQLTALQD